MLDILSFSVIDAKPANLFFLTLKNKYGHPLEYCDPAEAFDTDLSLFILPVFLVIAQLTCYQELPGLPVDTAAIWSKEGVKHGTGFGHTRRGRSSKSGSKSLYCPTKAGETKITSHARKQFNNRIN